MVQYISNVKEKITTGFTESRGVKKDTGNFRITLDSLRNREDLNNRVNNIEKVDIEMIEKKVMTGETLIKEIIQNIDAGHKKIEGILKLSMSGLKLSQQDLLTLQIRVYKFTQEVELISKLLEKSTSGVKQMVNTQI